MTSISSVEIHQKIHLLPSLPTIVLELLATMEREKVDVGDLTDKIAKDQTLTAKTLRLANSSFYGMTRQITTIHDAITLLGFRTVRNLATTSALIGIFNQKKDSLFEAAPFWRHALACAVCAKELAPYLRVDPDQAYAAGLLHDIGRLVLVTQFQPQYESAMAYRSTHDCCLLEAEQAELGLTHAWVGELVARQWKLPQVIELAIAGHHDASISEMPAATFVVLAADVIAHALGFSNDPSDLVPSIPEGFMGKLGIDEQTLFQVFESAEKQFAAASLLLNT
jgi:putative nucleotidyltransferase with HDIG domain